MRKNILILLALCLAFAGCTTKRLYFEPGDENITKKISYSGSLPDDIIFANKQVATLDNGNVISKSGLNKNLKLNKGEILLNEAENKFIVSDVTGAIKVLDENGGIILDQNLSAQAIAANINGNNLAVLSADNHAYIIKINSGAVVLDRAFSQNFALDVRAAAPVFLDYLVVFGTLDGKIAIADLNINRITQEYVISAQPFFNNVIELGVHGQNLYGATATKIVKLAPTGVQTYAADIKDVIFDKDKIYLFLKDGVVQILDLNFQKINETKLTFAIFLAPMISDSNIYIVEKTGFLIRMNLNLNDVKIFELPDEIDDKIFSDKDNLYTGNKFLKFGDER